MTNRKEYQMSRPGGGNGYLDRNKPGFMTKSDAEEERKRKLTPLRRKIVEHLVATGDGPGATANALGCNRTSVTAALKDPYVQDEVQRQIGDRLSRAAAIAGNTLIGLAREAKSEYVQLQASDSILDRTGFKPPERNLHQVRGDVRINIDLG